MPSSVRDGGKKSHCAVQWGRKPKGKCFSAWQPLRLLWELWSNYSCIPGVMNLVFKQSQISKAITEIWLAAHWLGRMPLIVFFNLHVCSLLLRHNAELLSAWHKEVHSKRQSDSVRCAVMEERKAAPRQLWSLIYLWFYLTKRRAKPHRRATQFTFLMSRASVYLSRQQPASRRQACRLSEFVQHSMKWESLACQPEEFSAVWYWSEPAFTFRLARASSREHPGYRGDCFHHSIIPSNYTFEMEMKKKKSNIYMQLIDQDVPVSHVWGWCIMMGEKVNLGTSWRWAIKYEDNAWSTVFMKVSCTSLTGMSYHCHG